MTGEVEPVAWLVDPGAGSAMDKVFLQEPLAFQYAEYIARGGSVTPLYASPAAGMVTVKPLKWELDEPDWWVAQPKAMIGGFGYEVRITDRGVVRVRRGTDDWFQFDGNEAQAKAYWQSDYKQRILSALQPSIE